MRKAFSANVSTARPKTRLGALLSTPPAQNPPPDETSSEADSPDVEPAAAAQSSVPAPVDTSIHDTIIPTRAALLDVGAEAASAPSPDGPDAEPSEIPPHAAAPEIEPAAQPRAPAGTTGALAPDQRDRQGDGVVEAARPAGAPAADGTSNDHADAIEDSKSRRARLKERIKAATNPVAVSQPTPQSATEARTSALSLIAALRHELEEVKALNAALSKDLEQTRNELTRAAEEARSRTEEANRMAGEVEERSRLLEELGLELTSLESERNDVLVELRGAQSDLAALKTAYAGLEEKVASREAELAETLSEEERLAADLEFQVEAQRRTEKALRAIEQERDTLARQVEDLTRERADLIESQRALDEIHRALADARSRIL